MAMRTERLSKDQFYSTQHLLSSDRTIAVFNHALKNGGWVSAHEDITDCKNSETRIKQPAHFDTLTGLANRIGSKPNIIRCRAIYVLALPRYRKRLARPCRRLEDWY